MEMTVKLRTGEVALTPMVGAVSMSLKSLMQKRPIALYELVMLCRDPKHELFGNAGDILKELNLIEGDGRPHDDVRQIVLASTEGEGMDMHLVSPLAEETSENPKATEKTADIHDLALFIQMRKIADIIFDTMAANPKVRMEDERSESANPYYNQTANGFFLEFYYGKPSSLWTPWGKYSIKGSSSGECDKEILIILDRLGAEVHEEGRQESIGYIGPVYSLHKIDGVDLPEPVILNNKAYSSYNEINESWAKLEAKYK